jgi:quercetin dioxygenase-like cupin family protein
MELVKQAPTFKGPENWFTGDVWGDTLFRGEEPSRLRAGMVKFSPGARTVWHSHGLGQALYIVQGIALIQARGGEIVEARPGDVVWTPPGEEHWHGAAPDSFMIHLALWETDDVSWLEPVAGAEYSGARVSTRTRS